MKPLPEPWLWAHTGKWGRALDCLTKDRGQAVSQGEAREVKGRVCPAYLRKLPSRPAAVPQDRRERGKQLLG